VKSPPPEVNSGRKFDIQSRHNAFLKTFNIYGKIIGFLKSIIFFLLELILELNNIIVTQRKF